jgi:hypothetical protein
MRPSSDDLAAHLDPVTFAEFQLVMDRRIAEKCVRLVVVACRLREAGDDSGALAVAGGFSGSELDELERVAARLGGSA